MVKLDISVKGDKLCISNGIQGVSLHSGQCLICREQVYALGTCISGKEIYLKGFLCTKHEKAMKKICGEGEKDNAHIGWKGE